MFFAYPAGLGSCHAPLCPLEKKDAPSIIAAVPNYSMDLRQNFLKLKGAERENCTARGWCRIISWLVSPELLTELKI